MQRNSLRTWCPWASTGYLHSMPAMLNENNGTTQMGLDNSAQDQRNALTQICSTHAKRWDMNGPASAIADCQ